MLPRIENQIQQQTQQAMQEREQQRAVEAEEQAKKEAFEQELLSNGGYVVTPEILEQNEPLRRSGLAVGDYLVPDQENEGAFKYFRTNSTEPKGMVVTPELLSANPELSKYNLEVGDQLEPQEDGTYKPFYSGYNNSLKNFTYFLQSTDWDFQKLDQYLLARDPAKSASQRRADNPEMLGFKGIADRYTEQGFQDSNELVRAYKNDALGADFDEISFEERRERIADFKAAQLQEKYPDLIPEEDTMSAVLGQGTTAVLDPAYVILPFKKLTDIVASSTGIATLAVGSEQLKQTGEIDPEKFIEDGMKLAATIAVGAKALPLAVQGTAKAVSTTAEALPKIPSKVSQAVSSGLRETSALKARELGNVIANKQGAGKPKDVAFKEAIDELGITKEQAIEYIMRTEAGVVAKPSRLEQAIVGFNDQLENFSTFTRNFSKGTDRLLGMVSTRIKNTSPELWGKLQRFERNTMTQTQQAFERIKPFAEQVGQLTAKQREEFNYLAQRNLSSAKQYLNSAGLDGNVVELLRKELDDMYDLMRKNGFNINKVDDYMPRLVKDYEGLTQALGNEAQSRIEKALEKYAKVTNRIDKETKRGDVSLLKTEEKARIADLVITGHDFRVIKSDKDTKLATMWKLSDDGVRMGFMKTRKFDEIPRQFMKYYEDPLTAVERYFSGNINKINKRKLFNFDEDPVVEVTPRLTRAKTAQAYGAVRSNLMEMEDDISVGMFVNDMIERNMITSDKVDEITDLLNARFGKGEESAPVGMSLLRDFGYLGTIANPFSAITNFSDLAFSMYSAGIKNTMKAAFGEKSIKMIDLGIEKASQEFQDTSSMARMMGRAFKYSGFQFTDRFGKETIINATIRKHNNLARTSVGEAKIRQRWTSVFGKDDVDTLIGDLQAGRVTDLTKDLAFMELSKFQPISRLEASEFYMNNPNWRIAYMLKSFTLKQWDLVRNDVIKQIRSGNKVEGYKNLAMLATYMGAATTSTSIAKDFIRGREIDPERIPNRFLWQTMGVFGFDKYSASRYLERGDFEGWLVNQIKPAVPLFNAAMEGVKVPFAMMDEEREIRYNQLIRPLPIFGDFMYHWFFGGIEKANEQLERERRAEEREEQEN